MADFIAKHYGTKQDPSGVDAIPYTAFYTLLEYYTS